MKKEFWLLLLICLTLKVAFSQVNLQTGAAQASIPLYNYSDASNRIGTSISLDYVSGSGLRVNEMPTSVGAGWMLNLGGSITRIQHGEPDDQKQDLTFSDDYSSPNNSNTPYKTDYYPNGYLFSEYNANTAVDNGAGYTMFCISPTVDFRPRKKYLADREQDEFEFTFGGRPGRFVIAKNGDIRTIVDSKLKIEKVLTNMTGQNIRTRISEFQIVDEYGIKYIFKDLELSELLKYDQIYGAPVYFTGNQSTNDWNLNKRLYYARGINQFVVNKWHLTDIINPLTNVKISFTYEQYNIDINASESFHRSSSGTEASKNYTFIWSKIKGTAKRIKKISCSSLESVEFKYNSHARADLNSDYALQEVIVKYNERIKYSWNFTFGYFHFNSILSSDPTSYAYDPTQSRLVRLCLLSAQKKSSGISEPAYQFDYHLEYEVPAMFSYYHDHWGYKNATTAWYEGYDFAQQLNKQDLFYPLEHSTTARAAGNKHATAGILKSIRYPTGGSMAFEYEQNSSVGSSQEPVLVGGVRVNKTILTDGINSANNVITEYKYIKESGLTSGWGYEPFIYSRNTPLRIYKSPAGLKSPGVNFYSINSDPLRIGKDGLTNKNYTSTSQRLSSAVSQTVVAIVINYIVNILQDVFAPDFKDYNSEEVSSEALNANNLLPIQYSRVEVIPKFGNSNLGKTIYEFTSNEDYPVARQAHNFPYSNAPRLAYWKYGLLKKISVNDNAGIVKMTEHIYTPVDASAVGDVNYVSQKWGANRKFIDDNDPTPSMSATSDMAHDFYYPLFGRMELTESKEYTNNGLNEYSVQTTTYNYSLENYLASKIITTGSQGDITEWHSYYPVDYSLAGTIATLKQNNIVAVPIATQTFKKKNGTPYLVAGNVNEHSIVNNGDVKITKVYAYESAAPVNGSLVQFSASQLIPNTSLYNEKTTIKYNQHGLPVETQTRDRINVKIFDYNNKLVVAEIMNASAEDIAYTSFESDGKGNWSFSGSTQYDKSVTGEKSYSLAGGELSKHGLDASKKYTLTYWSRNGAYSVAGTQSGYPKSLSTITVRGTAWTLYCHEITGASSVTINGTGFVDEVRLYPSNARMSTYTYDPMFGVTAQCDENSRIIYNHYDEFGRLQVVRDQNSNILKQYCYNYAGQTENCEVRYYSRQRKGMFTRQCAGIGGQIEYVVPYGKHYSLTSPEDADAIADNDVQTNGQNYANENGSCISANVTIINNGNIAYTIHISGTAINGQSFYTSSYVSAGTSKTIEIPPGTYTTTFNPSSAPNTNYTFSINGFTSLPGYQATISNVPINSSCSAYIM